MPFVTLIALLVECGCTTNRDVADVVQLLKAEDELNPEYVVNPLEFLGAKIWLPGIPIIFDREVPGSFQDATKKLASTDESSEIVDSAELLYRIANISATIRPELTGRIRVNEPYKRDHINIYFLSKLIAPRQLRGACAYVGYGGVILCDGQSLTGIINGIIQRDEFLQVLVVDGSSGRKIRKEEIGNETLTSTYAVVAGGFLSWVLAHEIGHYVNDYKDVEDKGNVAHFRGADLLSEKEIRADEFAANALKGSRFGSAMAGASLMEFMAIKLSELSAASDTLSEYQRSQLIAGLLPSSFKLELKDTLDGRLLVRAASVSSVFSQTENFGDGGFSEQILSSVEVSDSSMRKILSWAPYLIVISLVSIGAYIIVIHFRSGEKNDC